MSKPEWGIKRVCPSCSIKYYDFNKSPIICPKCQFEFDPDLLLKSRKGRSIATKEINISSNDAKKEETLEEEIDVIEDNDNILEIEDEEDIEQEKIDSNIEKDIDNEDTNIEIIDDDLDEKDDFSIEIDDDSDQNEDEK